MQLLVVRHADAGDKREFAKTGKPDDQRPLSTKGHQQMERVADALVKLVPECRRVVSSPYVRAVQTAGYVRSVYSIEKEITTKTLEPDAAPEQLAEWLRDNPAKGVTAIVGHEPQLSTFVTWLLAGSRDSRVELKKAGACFLRLDGEVRAGESELRWLLTPEQLSAVARETSA
jgi:phosphohistidine phosphatase